MRPGTNYDYAGESSYQTVTDDSFESVLGRARRGRREEELKRNLQRMEMNQPAPSGSYVEVREQGWFGKNKQDQAWADTVKGNEDLTVAVGRVVTNSGKLAVLSHEVATRGLGMMHWEDAALPEPYKGTGEVLTERLFTTVATTCVKAGEMHAELSFRAIAKRYKE